VKVKSIWQPYASLVVHGHKFFETSTWPAPSSLIGQTLGIASTKNLKPEQRAAFEDPEFSHYYEASGMPALEELPFGYLLGTVLVHSCELITEDLMEDVTAEELSYGWWVPGSYAWRLRYPKAFERPIPIVGKQGLYEFRGFSDEAQAQGTHQEGATPLRGHLSLA
jgi:hypothetical protein